MRDSPVPSFLWRFGWAGLALLLDSGCATSGVNNDEVGTS
jgi:hypothetical protein